MRCAVYILIWLTSVTVLFAAEHGSLPTVTREEARLLEQARDMAETNALAAVQILDAARQRADSSAALDYSAANLMRRAGRDAEARDAYRRALGKLPEFDAARLELARTLASLESWMEAETVLRPLSGKTDASLEILMLHGYILLSENRFIAGEWAYRRALIIYGETAATLHGLARALMGQQRAVEGTAVLEELVRLTPDDTMAWALLADAWLMRERPDIALIRLETARRFGALNVPMTMLLGDLYVNHDLAEEAAAVYFHAMNAESGAGDLSLRAAEGLLLAGQMERVETVLDQYIAVHTSPDTRYYRLRTRWAIATGDQDAALDAGREWVHDEPLHDDALLTMGDLADAADDPETAALWYERARDAHPRSVQPLLRLARLATERRDYDAAAAHLERATMIDHNPAVLQSLRHVRLLSDIAKEDLP